MAYITTEQISAYIEQKWAKGIEAGKRLNGLHPHITSPSYIRSMPSELLTPSEDADRREMARQLHEEIEHSRANQGQLCSDELARQGKGCVICLRRYRQWQEEREFEAWLETV